MIDSYYNGVIEQVYNRVGNLERNIVMVKYNNEFSIRHLDNIKHYSAKESDTFFAWHDFRYGTLPGAYAPFLDTVCNMYRKYVGGDFSSFLEECGVYELQRPLLLSYYETGVCRRDENVLLKEVAYEQERMTEAMANMLRRISREHPVVIVINRFQRASRSTLELVRELIVRPSINIGLVLGVNDSVSRQENSAALWDSIVEHLEESSQIYHIGSSGRRRADESELAGSLDNYELEWQSVENMYGLLDYEQARLYFQQVEHRIKFEDAHIRDEMKLQLYLLYARTSILLGELFKALELVGEIAKLKVGDSAHSVRSECAYLMATCYMYQGKLEQAKKYAKRARQEALCGDDEKQVFKSELLMVQAQMSGWYNIFFCVQDIPIDEKLIERLMKYNWRNHLAHIYIYAYDNRPEVVAKAYRTEAALFYFSKGVALAKEIGNRELVYDAYQKNIMIASTNGMNEIAMLYLVRTSQFLQSHGDLYEGRTFTGIGYNLSAMGHNAQAEVYYNRAMEVYYKLRMPEDIAEVYYNHALNNIMQNQFAKAEHNLQMVMKVIDKLHLNSLRVCNLSKLYGLLALACILQGDRFNCERHLLGCQQFLNYIIEKDRQNQDSEIIHDYAKCDDDMFLYTFSSALLDWMNGEDELAFSNFEKAEKYLQNAEGNQFFAYRIFRQKRMELFQKLGRMELYERESVTLEQRKEFDAQIMGAGCMQLLAEVELGDYAVDCRISDAQIEALIKQEGVLRDYKSTKAQMEFIAVWQKLIDERDASIASVVSDAVSAFLNHFNLDRAVYVCFNGHRPHVLYNDTEVEMSPEVIEGIRGAMKEYPQGFAVSKIRETFFEHQDVISYFGMDDVCSFVAVPFSKNGELTSILITYVRMRDNWHGSIERYMLGEDDLRFYQLLFREMEYSINRMEANEKVREMNSKLQAAAVTDVLTGIYNRAGMYEAIHRLDAELKERRRQRGIGLMFIDLDNFKHYNDTYGHDVGDLILKEMAAIFGQVASGKGFVSRYGGDEFIILLDTSAREELEALAREIYVRIHASNGFQKQIENYLGHPVEVDGQRLITCSIGIAAATDVRGEDDVNELIRRADDGLYSVKTSEKGRYVFI